MCYSWGQIFQRWAGYFVILKPIMFLYWKPLSSELKCVVFFFFTRYWTVIKEGCICLLVSNTDNEFPRVHSHTLWYITLPVKIGKRENSTQLSISWTDHDDPTISYVFIWHILIPNPELLSSYPPKSDHRRDCKLPLRSCLRLFTLLLMPKPPTIKPGICDM